MASGVNSPRRTVDLEIDDCLVVNTDFLELERSGLQQHVR